MFMNMNSCGIRPAFRMTKRMVSPGLTSIRPGRKPHSRISIFTVRVTLVEPRALATSARDPLARTVMPTALPPPWTSPSFLASFFMPGIFMPAMPLPSFLASFFMPGIFMPGIDIPPPAAASLA